MPPRASSPSSARPLSAVVTGGARGIGRGIAERLVARGYQVVVADVDGGAALATAEEIGAAAGIGQDVRDRDSHAAVAAEAARHGALAVWCNNAGVGDDGRLSETGEDAVRRLVDVNLLGTLWGMQAALEGFGTAGGDIVNTASLAGLAPVPGYTVYAASKAAIVSATMSVAGETPRRVRVHAICPDGVQTAMLDGQTPGGLGSLLVHSGGRILTVDEVADQAVALIGARRIIRSVPGWRGGVSRFGAMLPSVTAAGTTVLAAQGRRALGRRGRA